MALINFTTLLHGYSNSLRQTEAVFDAQLKDIAQLLAVFDPNTRSLFDKPSDKIAFQVWSASGELLQRSNNAPSTPMGGFSRGFSDNNFGEGRWRIYTEQNDGRWIAVAERMDIRFRLADDVVMEYVVPFLIGLPAAGVLIWLIIGSGFSVLTKLTNELTNKRSDDLTTLELRDPPIELRPTVAAINGLLRRLNNALEREKQFSADAAHELRTPLSALKVHFHNLKEHLKSHDDSNFASLEQDIQRLQRLLEQILQLHRASAEQIREAMEPVDLYLIAQQELSDLYWDFDQKQQSVALEGEHCSVSGNAEFIKLMIRNILVNANKYSPPKTDVKIEIKALGEGTLMRIEDAGPGIPPAEQERVFDRFYRVGGDRHSTGEIGSGLGLSIVRRIASLHQASISLSAPANHSGLIVEVFFPLTIKPGSLTQDVTL